MSMTQQTAEQLNDLRARIAAGEDVSKEEVAQAVQELRSQRMSGVSSAKSAAAKPKKDVGLPEDLNDLFPS